MMYNITCMLAAWLAQAAVFVIPTFITARRLVPGQPWPCGVLLAAVLGIGSQALLGALWGHLVGHDAAWEAVLWLAGWLAASAFAFRRAAAHAPVRQISAAMSAGQSLALAGILLAGLALRAVHPLQHWALGQSDAYSHLQFIHDIVDYGKLQNPIYPPGHAWVMALPALVFNLDPYILARFGGAFFGALLILGVHVLTLHVGRSVTAAFAAAFLAGCFPAFNLLHKTGVGVFANQMGLALIPAIFIFHIAWVRGGCGWNTSAALLAFSLAAMGITSSIMLIHVVLLLAAERLIPLVAAGRKALPALARLGLIMVPMVALLAFHIAQSRHGHARAIDINMHTFLPERSAHGKAAPVAPGQPKKKHLSTPAQAALALRDFLSVKRLGYHDLAMNGVSSVILAAFAICLAAGLRRRSEALVLLGLWGCLTSLQALTGALQFTSYQREGWSLLIAFAVLGGLVFAICYGAVGRFRLARWLTAAAVLASATWAFLHPPEHRFFTSAAEDDLVQWTRQLTAVFHPSGRWPDGLARRSALPKALQAVSPREQPVLVTPRTAGWGSGQGELAGVIGRGMPCLLFSATDDVRTRLKPGRTYIILLEDMPEGDPAGQKELALMRSLQPALVGYYVEARRRQLAAVQSMNAFLAGDVAARNWSISRASLAPSLAAIVLQPR